MSAAKSSLSPVNLPLQYTPFRKEQFNSDEGIDTFNLQWQQVINTVNQAVGNAGRVVIPSGIDVAGSNITGLGAPTHPTDAISSGHADAKYGGAASSANLDLGGNNTLKGLSSLYLNLGATANGAGLNATITLAKITGGGSNGSITIANGIVTSFVAPT